MSRKRQRIKNSYSSFCAHRRYTLDESSREVRCDECNADLDPFEVLKKLCRGGSYQDMLNAERKSLAKKIAYLKGEERRVKARLKNASRKDADAAVAEERARWERRMASAARACKEAAENAEKAARMLGEHRVRPSKEVER